MNRAERRSAEKKKPSYLRGSETDLVKRLFKNGITVQDMAENYDRGKKDGYTQGVENAVTSIYAAIILAANELYGFGNKRCTDLIRAVDHKLTYSITSKEVMDEVYKKVGITLDFKDPFDRVQ